MTKEIKSRVVISQPKRLTEDGGANGNVQLGQGNQIKKDKKGCC